MGQATVLVKQEERGSRSLAAVVLGFIVATAVLTFPLVRDGNHVGPTNTGDGQWSLWSTASVARSLVREPLRVYDANIFHPHERTLAFSEANLVGGVLGIPGWVATGNPYATYSTSLFLSFLLAAACTFALVRYLTGNSMAAFLCGLAFAFAPFVVVRLAHVQLLMTAGLPLSLLALHRLVDRPTAGRALALACALALAALCSGYYGIFAGVAVSLGFAYYALTRGLWRLPRFYLLCLLAVSAAAVLVAPFFVPYLRIAGGVEPFRALEEARLYSATWRSYLSSPSHLHRVVLGAFLTPEPGAFPERILFPGFLVGGFAALASACAIGWPGKLDRAGARGRETVGYYVLLAAVGAWLSLGPAGHLYTWAYRVVPAWSLLRCPSRFGTIVTLALIVLAGVGLSAILKGRPRILGLGASLVMLLVAELAAAPLDLRPALPVPAAHRLLAGLPNGALAEFPFFFLPSDFHRHSQYMLYSTAHWHPLVNGYSDHIPGDFKDMAIPVSSFPARSSFRLLRERGTRYVIFHLRLYDQRSRAKLTERLERYKGYLRPIIKQDEVWLFEIVDWPE